MTPILSYIIQIQILKLVFRKLTILMKDKVLIWYCVLVNSIWFSPLSFSNLIRSTLQIDGEMHWIHQALSMDASTSLATHGITSQWNMSWISLWWCFTCMTENEKLIMLEMEILRSSIYCCISGGLSGKTSWFTHLLLIMTLLWCSNNFLRASWCRSSSWSYSYSFRNEVRIILQWKSKKSEDLLNLILINIYLM